MTNWLCNDVDLFSVLMPTKDRPEFLKRSLDFLARQGFAGQVLITDGSSDDMASQNTQIVNNQKKISIVYIHTGNIENQWTEMHQVLKEVTSKYSLLYHDDDFFFLDEIDYCLEFLENNEDYTSARGRFAWVNRKSNQMQFSKMPMYSFTEAVTERRIADMFSNYCHLCFGIMRRDVFLNALNQVPKYLSKCAWFDQFAITILCGVRGKSYTSPRLFCVRQVHPGQSQRRLIKNDPYAHWPMIIASPDFSNDYQNFRQCLINNCRDFLSVDDERLGEVIDHGLLALINRGFGVRPPLERGDKELLAQLKNPSSIDHQRMLQIVPFLAPVLSEE